MLKFVGYAAAVCAAFALSVSPAGRALACTGIRIEAEDGSIVYARTLEFGVNLQSQVLLLPRWYEFVGSTASGKPGLTWNSKFAAVGMNAYDYDMLDPGVIGDCSNTAILTVGALEQLHDKWGAFLIRMIEARPQICVHVEPVIEWYNSDEHAFDKVAIAFHRRRQYLEGFVGQIEYLESRGKAEIIERKRVPFGSRFIEGYSLIIWRPI